MRLERRKRVVVPIDVEAGDLVSRYAVGRLRLNRVRTIAWPRRSLWSSARCANAGSNRKKRSLHTKRRPAVLERNEKPALLSQSRPILSRCRKLGSAAEVPLDLKIVCDRRQKGWNQDSRNDRCPGECRQRAQYQRRASDTTPTSARWIAKYPCRSRRD